MAIGSDIDKLKIFKKLTKSRHDGKISFTPKLNKTIFKTKEERERLVGFILPKQEPGTRPIALLGTQIYGYGMMRDWRGEYQHDASSPLIKTKNYTTWVRDQKNCAACAAFGIIGSMESNFMIQVDHLTDISVPPAVGIHLPSRPDGYRVARTVDLSESFLHIFGDAQNTPDQCEKRSNINNLIDYCVKTGVIFENRCPYFALMQQNLNCFDYSNAGQIEPKMKILESMRVQITDPSGNKTWWDVRKEIVQYDQMLNWLYDHGPIVATYPVRNDFMDFYGGEVYVEHSIQDYLNIGFSASEAAYLTDYVGGSEVSAAHAFCIVGYCNDPSRTPSNKIYFICKNSWGHDWGDCGYFLLDQALLFPSNSSTNTIDPASQLNPIRQRTAFITRIDTSSYSRFVLVPPLNPAEAYISQREWAPKLLDILNEESDRLGI